MTDVKTLTSPSGRTVTLPDRLAAYELGRGIGWTDPTAPKPKRSTKSAGDDNPPTLED